MKQDPPDRTVCEHNIPVNYPCSICAPEEFPVIKSGTKNDEGKPRVDLLSPIAMTKIAEVMTFGAKKYEPHNWRKGIAWSRVTAALLRHVFAFMRGEDKDPETGLSHLAHAGCCIMFLLDYEETRKEFDDRYKGK